MSARRQQIHFTPENGPALAQPGEPGFFCPTWEGHCDTTPGRLRRKVIMEMMLQRRKQQNEHHQQSKAIYFW